MAPGIDPRHEMIARRNTQIHGRTHVVLSFGAHNGGAYFARWLRWQIMQMRGYRQPNNVYLDTEALKLVPETRIEVKDNSRPWLTGVASMNGGWHDYYRYAMTQAHTMVFAITPEWANSPWCRKEARDFLDETWDRQREGRPPLRGISLLFDDTLPGVARTQPLRAVKQDVDSAIPVKEKVVHGNHAAAAAFGVQLKQAAIAPTPGWGGLFTMDGAGLLRLMQHIGRP